MPTRPPVGPPPTPPGLRFKSAIEKAILEGLAPSTLLLHLTRSDASKLRRDRSVATADISFADGEMRYLGVRVAEGDIAASALTVVGA